ncbi:MAG TPA: lysophospholipid acyltransferase family protein [Acidimicrobiales bacterium]|jgi:1-acyl-sn-glycerol-3-phosphate acyltransferase|nr:lysophospholipid acyltransferase family protein [Acidimicrobiales bacterium]
MTAAFYAVIRAIVAGFCRVFWRLSIEGREHLPATGPFILSPVHRSNIDTPLAACVTTRRMRFMGKKEMWKIAPLGKVFTALGAFPVNRGTADREALRTCIDVLKNGEPLVLFPEGTRRSGPVVEELFDGAAYVATKAGVPIVPVGIGGSEGAMPKGAKFIKPVKVHMVIGPPLRPETGEGGKVSRSAMRDLTVRLQAELQRLYDDAQKKAGAS